MDRFALGVLVLIALGGCGGDDDGGDGDSGMGDVDSGPIRIDSGPGGVDAGPSDVDAGPGGVDAGPGGVDAGRPGPDAGPMMCVPMGGSCAGEGALCCGMLTCCAGVPVPPGAEYCGATCPDSDRNIKHGFQSIDPEAVLQSVAAIPISTWSYDFEPGVRHMGPMAQDFRGVFGLGADDRHIHVIDSGGVSLAAIQALRARTERLASDNATLREDNARLREDLARIEARIDRLAAER